MCCFVGYQVVRVTALIYNVPEPVSLLPVRLGLGYAAGAVDATKPVGIAATARSDVSAHTVTPYLCTHP